MSLIDQVREKLDAQLADLESEVGEFLTLKKRILSSPSSATRQVLLDENAAIKDRAAQVITAAQEIKARISSFDPLDFSKYSQVPGMVQGATSQAQVLLALREDMKGHRARVDAYTKSTSSSPNSYRESPSILGNLRLNPAAKAMGMVVLAALGVAAMRRNKKGVK